MSRRYPAVALGLLAGAGGLQAYAVAAFVPDIARTLGIGVGTVAALAVLQSVGLAVAALPVSASAWRSGRPALISVVAGAASAGTLATTAIVTGPWGLATALLCGGAVSAVVRSVHPPLLVAAYDPKVRVGALSGYRAIAALAAAGAPGLIALLVAVADLSWRGALLAMSGAGLLAVLGAAGLRDRGGGAPHEPSRPAVVEVARGVLRVPTACRLLPAFAVIGAFAAPLPVYLSVFLEDRWQLGRDGRGAVFAAGAATAVIALALLARHGDRLLARGPAALVDAGWRLLLWAALTLVAAVTVPSFGASVALLCAALACVALLETALVAVLMTVVAPSSRPQAAALAGMALAAAGGIGGALLLGGLQETLGAGGAIAVLALPAVLAAVVLRAARDRADADLATMVAASQDEERVRTAHGAGLPQPVISCRGVVVAFGHRRALDDVDFALHQGELVAVLGTNGAGKSTLLRTLSGLSAPAGGTVRLDGFDVTLLGAERRAALGVAHVAGAASLFDPLTVRESLALAAHAAGLRGLAARQATERALAALPALADRAGGRVATLSGGERQLLALAQTAIRRPRVLLIDELSHGLAPAAAADALALVRGLHGDGASVVIVEQSVDFALAQAQRALFMERGRVRFDGPSTALRGRHDLLRPVLLHRVSASEAWR